MKYFDNGTTLGLVLVAAFAADGALADDSALQPDKSAFESEIRAEITVKQADFIDGLSGKDNANLVSTNEQARPWKNSIYFPIVPEHTKIRL